MTPYVVYLPSPRAEDRQMPASALRLLLSATQAVVGPQATRMILRRAGMDEGLDDHPLTPLAPVTFGEYARLEQAIEDVYGPRGARPILLRVGRELFRSSLQEHAGLSGFAGGAFRHMPFLSPERKIKLLLQQMVAAFEQTINESAWLEEDETLFRIVLDECACEVRPRHSVPCCLVAAGAFSQALTWLTGKPVSVREITCLNLGADACRYHIPKYLTEQV